MVGMKPYYLPAAFAKSNAGIVESQTYKLALIGDKYFIGTDFSFERVK
jgi:hypothetical protein